MASDIAISIQGLSKCYRVGHQAQHDANATLRDQIVRHARNLARKTRDMATGQAIVQGDTVEDFWAMRDVSFEIPRGARVGILGRNGAGKSTLLKLLSRITEPTIGRIVINGRVASLLEVGTGFHPELTGRENIFLNGAILGMSRVEIQRRFDEIVDFAEVERFLDTPVKRYSSGMYLRLAFAVAAHLESEILIVDEVLAVGDIQFQKKCLGKMDDIGRSGRTVLFVSHNIETVKALCSSAVLLQNGQVADSGPVDSVVGRYLASMCKREATRDGVWNSSSSEVGVKRVEVIQDGTTTGSIVCGSPFEVKVSVVLDSSCRDLELGIGFRDDEGKDIIRLNNKHLNQMIDWPKSGHISLSIQFPNFNWIHGEHVIMGIYFGYVNDSYIVLEDLMPIKLVKHFPVLSTEKIISGLNKIFIDGIRFQ